ncbi:MAG: chemotaxis response regulator protein-glutamate methylesterase, partial [Candidatus Omnitrophica bacterium]|nr:chemotaxis response regulator protein-glutamate methylesterase [Candidatus Omnitrophota bacterium]
RILVVDDSFRMRKIISDIISSDPGFEVIGKAKDGKEALVKVYSLKPDIVTLDVNIPLLDGISVLEEIMKNQPTRIIMVSAYTRAGTTATIKALELGALDFIAKPSGEISLDLTKLKDEIISKIKIAAKIDLDKFEALPIKPVKKQEAVVKKVVVIGASTGGPKAVLDLMKYIPADNNAVFIIVQHMPKGFTLSFAERISWQTGIKTKEAEDEDVVAPGKVYVAPSGYHLILEKSGSGVKIKLTEDPLINFVRPSIDVTMSSVAEVFGQNVIGVILTGMGKDGLEGARSIKSNGGYVIVQDEETSVIWGMPRAVYEAGLADKIMPLSKIPKTIMEYIEKEG